MQTSVESYKNLEGQDYQQLLRVAVSRNRRRGMGVLKRDITSNFYV